MPKAARPARSNRARGKKPAPRPQPKIEKPATPAPAAGPARSVSGRKKQAAPPPATPSQQTDASDSPGQWFDRLRTAEICGCSPQEISLDAEQHPSFPPEARRGEKRKYEYDAYKIKEWRASLGMKGSEPADEAKKTLLATKKEILSQQQIKTREMLREEEISTGQLLPRQDFELFTIETITEARDKLLALPIELRKHLCPKCLAKIPDELTRMIETVLSQLARIASGPAANDS